MQNTGIHPESFVIESLTYIPLGNHNPMFSHPYVINPTHEAINGIAESVYSTKSGKITTKHLNNHISGIMEHSGMGYLSPVDSNWTGTKRYIFLLKVKSIDFSGTETNSYIQGYTNYDGTTKNGHIDSDLEHNINNVIETYSMTINTPMGLIRKEKLMKIYNVFSPNENQEYYTQRPSDMLEHVNNVDLINVLGAEGSNFSVTSCSNTVSPFNSSIVGSNIDNSIPSDYLSKILNVGLMTHKEKEIMLNSFEMGMSDNNMVGSKLPEPDINDNRFIKYINYVSGYRFPRGKFSFTQLMNVDNTIYDRFTVIELTKDYVNPLLSQTPEVGDHWEGRDGVTIAAYGLIESSVALAIKYGFNKIFFTASNMTNPLGVAEVYITNFNSFINLDEHDFNYLLEIFKEKFITDIFLPETSGGKASLHVDLYIDLLGTTKIFLEYAGYPGNWFTIPTAANSLFSSVVTVNHNAFTNNVTYLNSLISELSGNISANQSYV